MKAALRWVLMVALLTAGTAAKAAEPTDLLLVLAADVSRSIDYQKFQLQRDGYAAAGINPWLTSVTCTVCPCLTWRIGAGTMPPNVQAW